MSLTLCNLLTGDAKEGYLSDGTSLGGSETITRDTVYALVPLAAFNPTTVLHSLYPDSNILQPLNLENKLLL
jgi:hypothetical protein